MNPPPFIGMNFKPDKASLPLTEYQYLFVAVGDLHYFVVFDSEREHVSLLPLSKNDFKFQSDCVADSFDSIEFYRLIS